MTTPPQPVVIFADSASAVVALLNNLKNPSYQPSLFLSLEGNTLGRYGSINLLTLYLLPRDTVYLVDVHHLGEAAFLTENADRTSLKTVLESTTTLKVMFDVRNDSNALFSHYQISLGGIKDVQLMELAARGSPRTSVAVLAKCIEEDAQISSAAMSKWRRTKDVVAQLFALERGGRYEVFDERPLRAELIQYCVQDVALLPTLYSIYEAKLLPAGESFWRAEIEKATQARVMLSHSTSYDSHGQQEAYGPWSGITSTKLGRRGTTKFSRWRRWKKMSMKNGSIRRLRMRMTTGTKIQQEIALDGRRI
jgi:exonuclease 3'-5' domain-containing protein 1